MNVSHITPRQMRRYRSPSRQLVAMVHWLRVGIAIVAITALANSVATRYCVASEAQSSGRDLVKAASIEAKRQHLLDNGLHWTAPVIALFLLEPAELSHAALPDIPLRPRNFFEDCLYNRPPPTC